MENEIIEYLKDKNAFIAWSQILRDLNLPENTEIHVIQDRINDNTLIAITTTSHGRIVLKYNRGLRKPLQGAQIINQNISNNTIINSNIEQSTNT